MRKSVREAFVPFIVQFEGRVPFMYCDVIGLVTTGIGNLIDPMPGAMSLPWRHRRTNELATRLEIVEAWRAVKQRIDLWKRGGMAYRDVTDLILDDAAIDRLVVDRLTMNDARLNFRYPDFEAWPAPAQLAVHSMAWGMGAGFRFPKFDAAILATPPDFTTAATECGMSNGAPKRNRANYRLLIAAAAVGDYDALDWKAA